MCNCRNSTYRTYYRFSHCVLFKHHVAICLFTRLLPQPSSLSAIAPLSQKTRRCLLFREPWFFGARLCRLTASLLRESLSNISHQTTLCQVFFKTFLKKSFILPSLGATRLYYHTFFPLSILCCKNFYLIGKYAISYYIKTLI